MRVLVIPDIHLKGWLFDKAANILNDGEADRAVCLMDIPDDWDKEMQVDIYRDTFDIAITFAKRYPDTLWCYGNHDVSYPWAKLETGYSAYAERTVMLKIEELERSLANPQQIGIIHRIGNCIFCHGGLTEYFVYWLNEELLEADIDEVITAVNDSSIIYLWNDASPLWNRPQHGDVKAFRSDRYTQVVGHTPVEHIYERNGFISVDVFSTNSDGTQIGESAMIVIDTDSCEYTKHNIHKD